jgi:hypothetical protein
MLTAEVSALSHVREHRITEEGWQVMKTKHLRQCTVPQLNSEAHRQQERRLLYLRKMKGMCFNYFAHYHKVASCHGPTRFGHTYT